MRKTVLLSFFALSMACTSTEKFELPYFNTANFTPIFCSKEQAKELIKHRIGAFELQDQNGQRIDTAFVKGRIHVANFFFTSCPSICPRMMNNLEKVQQAFEGDNNVQLLSFSVTPGIDSVGRLKKYAEENNIGSNWHLLTGNKEAIYKLARCSYFAEEELGFTKDSSDFLHTEHVLLVDQDLRIRGVYNSTLPLDMEHLVEDIQLLKED